MEPDQHPDPLVRGTGTDPYQNVTDPEHCFLKSCWHNKKFKMDTVRF
jgi:hypothetical protein